MDDGLFIIKLRCQERGVSLAMLANAPRTRFWTRFRQELSAELRAKTELSWGDISWLLGRKEYRGKRERVEQKS